MREAHREQLLQRVFAEKTWPGADAAGDGRFDRAVLFDVLASLVFAQRPIDAAGKEVADSFDLGPRGPFILSLIDRGLCYPKDLATVLRIGPSLVTAEIARLTEAGLVATTAGTDRRRTQLSLTPRGEAVNATARNRLVAIVEQNLSAYSAEDVSLFAGMLRAVGRFPGD